MRLRRASLLTVLALTASVPAVDAQNLVVNAEFDTNVNSWTISTPLSTNISWSPLDWQGSPTSGSGLVTNVATTAGTASVLNPCQVASVSGNYELGGHIRFPTQGMVGVGSVSVWFYGSPTCTGNPTSVVNGQFVNSLPSDVWVPTLVQGLSVSAGQAFIVRLNVTKNLNLAQTLRAHFDFVRFGLEGTTPVQLQSFQVE